MEYFENLVRLPEIETQRLYILKANIIIFAHFKTALVSGNHKKLSDTKSRVNERSGYVLKRFSRRRFPSYIETNH